MKKQKTLAALTLPLILTLAACQTGGGQASSSNTSSTPATSQNSALPTAQQLADGAETSASPTESVAEMTSPARPQLTPSDEIVTETYQVQGPKSNLYGVITAPADYRQRQLPAVIISHGFNNTLEMYEEYAQDLARAGYLVYRFDFYGGSRASKSGGQDMLDMSVLTELADLEAVLESLRQEDFVDNQWITLLGASQGGVVSSLYASKHPQNLAKLVLIFPAFVLFDDVQETYRRLGSPQPLPQVLTHAGAQLGGVYVQDAMTINIEQEQEKIQVPTLIIHGTNDAVVPYSYAQEAQGRIPDARLVIVQGGIHWVDANFNQVALPAIQEFLAE